ncbi:NAD-binding protein [Planctomycetes bacterium K23_9]|uniref:Alkaline phosphatase synthesis transcriptional regulatory protein PhoP n=1 Tax=Stieleria marina TaxID=1930275 RepID=A0A517NQV1_9BACT|nr:Alkaline phosphatase synthesis transcriptional regulatory protein PhoP [Planctomycetes bacterium K23_9]
MKESASYLLPILVFVATILTFGTMGYLVIEDNISISDAFYMAVTAITPTQFDEVHQLSVPGRYFTVLLVFCGFGAVVAFATQFARLIIQSELEGVGVITRKQMSRRISRMKNHYIVCGYGEIGSAICGELRDQQFPFVVITNDETAKAAISREGYASVTGNPTADTSLKEAGIERAVGVIAILTDDADNLFIALAARELNPKILIIARGEDSGVEDRILRAGADIVVSPMKLGGQQIAQLIKQQAGELPDAEKLLTTNSVMGLQLTTYRHHRSEPTTAAAIMLANEAIGIAGIRRDEGVLKPCPSGTEVRENDALVLIRQVNESGETFHKPPTGKTILLADDHRALRLLFSRKLSAAGHDVIQAATGDEAVRLANSREPDLIVLDVNMPGRDGFEVCQTIRQTRRLSTIPIILYSGQDNFEFSARGKQVGADLCIRKTSKSAALLEQIEEVFTNNFAHEEPTVPDPNARTTPSFDLQIALENVGNDRKLLRDLVVVLHEETPSLMQEISTAIDQHDPFGLQSVAHTLKGSVMVVGATDAVATALKLEQADSGSDWPAITKLRDQLKIEIDALLTELDLLSLSTLD